MKTSRLTFGTFALLATVGAPICASAATLGPEAFTLSLPSGSPTEDTYDTSLFNQFNPSLGTLTGLTATIGGDVDWQVNFLPISPIFDTLTVIFITPGVTGSSQMQNAFSPGTVPVTVNLTNTLSSPNPFLADYEGTGKTFLQVEFDDVVLSGNFVSSTDGLSGSITYTYTPAATPLPAALPMFATGLGGLGLLGWRRKRKNAAALAAA